MSDSRPSHATSGAAHLAAMVASSPGQTGQAELELLANEITNALDRSPVAFRVLLTVARDLSFTDRATILQAEFVERMTPDPSEVSAAAFEQVRMISEARTAAMREFGAFTAAQVAELRGVPTSNPHSLLGRWLAEGAIFALPTADARTYPGFQFEDGRPRPAMARVIAAMSGAIDGWDLLLWFTAPNGHLDGRRPVDLLASDPDAVVEAAAYQAALSED